MPGLEVYVNLLIILWDNGREQTDPRMLRRVANEKLPAASLGWLDGDIVFGESLRALKSVVDALHFRITHRDFFVVLSDVMHARMPSPPRHTQSTGANHFPASEQNAIPFVLQRHPAAFNRIVLAVVRGIVNQANFQARPIGKFDHAAKKLFRHS